MFDASFIPGMIDPAEQGNLFRLASTGKLTPEVIFVEFGTFLGRSTACIDEGLCKNPTRVISNKLFA